MEADRERRFLCLYEAHHRAVYAYFKRRIDSESARDGTVETFLVAWRRIDKVPDGERALPWLYGVARRVLANQRRARKRRGRLINRLARLSVETAPPAEMIVVRRSEEEAVVAALGKLQPAEQELLMLATWEEMPHAEIGQMLGCSAHAVDQRIYRATRHLARAMGSSGHKHDETIPRTPRTGVDE
jgi:RNA polymerase sigma-70 factor (ECF subfamily)